MPWQQQPFGIINQEEQIHGVKDVGFSFKKTRLAESRAMPDGNGVLQVIPLV